MSSIGEVHSQELRESSFPSLKGAYGSRVIVHLDSDVYSLFIDKSEDVYLDHSKKELLRKHVFISLYRPLHGFLKWVSIPIEIVLDVRRHQGDFKERIVKRIADVVRIPVLTVAMEIVHLTGLLFGVFNSDYLSLSRKIAGKLELNMYRKEAPSQEGIESIVPLADSDLIPSFSLKHLRYMDEKEERIQNFCQGHLSELKKTEDLPSELSFLPFWSAMCAKNDSGKEKMSLGDLAYAKGEFLKGSPWERVARKCGVSNETYCTYYWDSIAPSAARDLLFKGMSIEEVSAHTRLQEEVVKELSQQMVFERFFGRGVFFN